MWNDPGFASRDMSSSMLPSGIFRSSIIDLLDVTGQVRFIWLTFTGRSQTSYRCISHFHRNWEQVDAVQMSLPTGMYLHERSHDILQRYIGFDHLLSTFASWNFRTGDFLGGDLQSQGWPPWFWCYKDFIARAFWGTIVFISCRFSASLDGGSMRVPFLWKSFYVWQCGRTLFPTCCILQTGFCHCRVWGTST